MRLEMRLRCSDKQGSGQDCFVPFGISTGAVYAWKQRSGLKSVVVTTMSHNMANSHSQFGLDILGMDFT